MKLWLVGVVAVGFPGLLPAQHNGAPPAGVVPSAGALGGSFTSVGISRPLGGIAPPTFPAGVKPPRRQSSSNNNRFGYYGPPIYYGGYSGVIVDSSSLANGSFGFGAGSYANNAPLAEVPAAPPPAPVIINQYFGDRTQESGRAASPQTAPGTQYEEPSRPGDPIGPQQNYYLIAYKNRSIYSALAYWVEGDTLHYVTTENQHNQASLALIDLEKTAKLNAGNAVPFALPK
jgi:hypothetical protein